MSQIFVNTRQVPAGVYTDFNPPNTLLSVLGIPVGIIVKQVDHQIHVPPARPIASDFQPPNILLGTFITPKAPFVPPPTSDNAFHLLARWSATDFSPPVLVGRFLGPPPLRALDTMGDAWSSGKVSFRGVYSDFIAPNVVLRFPPPLVGPYVPVEIGVEINRRNVHKDFVAPNITLSTLTFTPQGTPFRSPPHQEWAPKRTVVTDFSAPNFLTSALQTSAPFSPQDLPAPAARKGAGIDFAPPNLLASTFRIFLGNPPKIQIDPLGFAIRRPGIYDDSPQANFLAGPSSLIIAAPLSMQDDGANAFRPKALPTDFIAPNLLTGILIAAAPPQPPSPVTVPIPGQQLLPYTFPDAVTAYRRITEVVNQLVQGRGGAAGRYQAPFGSGPVQYAGPSNQLAGSDNLIFGLNLPNPAGTPGPALLMGSGGGNGTNIAFWLITDQAFDTLTPGNDLYMTAGETQPGSSARGGNLTLIGGATDAGLGGQTLIQGGTSVTGRGGAAVLQGGNSTGKVSPPGDAFVIAGLVGNTGGNVHLVATLPDGSGVYGVIRHRANSIPRWDEFVGDGSWFFYDGSGFGNVGAPVVSQGPGQPVGFATDGYTGTFTAGARTITVVQGRITNVT